MNNNGEISLALCVIISIFLMGLVACVKEIGKSSNDSGTNVVVVVH